MSGRRYTMFSAGQGSFRAAMIDRRRHPDAEYGLVFTDTLYEDADAYRFLIEGAAQVLDKRLNWTVRAEDFPDYRVPDDTPIEEYRGNPEWRAFLAYLRDRATDALPGLIWLVEGRDPWEIFRDKRFLGNSQKDPCSEIAKRLTTDQWRIGQCHRIGELFEPADWFAVGIGDHEAHRFNDEDGRGIGVRMAADGWQYHAPLLTDCLPGEESLFFAPDIGCGHAEPRTDLRQRRTPGEWTVIRCVDAANLADILLGQFCAPARLAPLVRHYAASALVVGRGRSKRSSVAMSASDRPTMGPNLCPVAR